MRPRISIRGCVHPSVRRSVGPSVRRSPVFFVSIIATLSNSGQLWTTLGQCWTTLGRIYWSTLGLVFLALLYERKKTGDRRTDRRMDTPSYRDARTHLKRWSQVDFLFFPSPWACVIFTSFSIRLYINVSTMVPMADDVVMPLWFDRISLSSFPYTRDFALVPFCRYFFCSPNSSH